MMSIISAFWILHGSPRDGSALRGNHDNFGSLLQQAALEQTGRHPQGTTRTNVNRLELFGKIQGFQGFHRLNEISSIVNEL